MLLQEVWVAADVELLRQAAAEGGLPHSFHFLCGAIGSGLLLLSRFRIAQVSTQAPPGRGACGAAEPGSHPQPVAPAVGMLQPLAPPRAAQHVEAGPPAPGLTNRRSRSNLTPPAATRLLC